MHNQGTSILMTEAAGSSETSVYIYQTTCCHIPDDGYLRNTELFRDVSQKNNSISMSNNSGVPCTQGQTGDNLPTSSPPHIQTVTTLVRSQIKDPKCLRAKISTTPRAGPLMPATHVQVGLSVLPATGRRSVCRFRHTFQLKLYRRSEQIRKLVRPTGRPDDCAGVPERV
jgi:hypothetical protein